MSQYLDGTPPHVDIDGLAALVGNLFTVPIRPATEAVKRELRAIETRGRRGMDRQNLAASDVASVIEALADRRR